MPTNGSCGAKLGSPVVSWASWLRGPAQSDGSLAKIDFANDLVTIGSQSYTIAQALEPESDWNNGGDLSAIILGQGLVSEAGTGEAYKLTVSGGLPSDTPLIAVMDFHFASAELGNAVAMQIFNEIGDWDWIAVTASWEDGDITQSNDRVPLPNIAQDADHKFALLITTTAAPAVSIDGGTVVEAIPLAPANPYDTIAVKAVGEPGEPTILRTVTFFDGAGKTAADLPALSAL